MGLLGLLSSVTPSLETSIRDSPLITPEYTSHDPIIIYGDSDFQAQGWPGNGSADNPYMIDDLAINAISTCINIENTRVHVVVQNCLLSGLPGASSTGIRLRNTTNVFIKGNEMQDVRIGALVFESTNATVDGNHASVSFVGVSLIDTSECLVSNNTVEGDPSMGIGFSSSQECRALNNTVKGRGTGLAVYDSFSCEMSYNALFGCSLNIRPKDGSPPNKFVENYVNGKPLKVLHSEENIEVQVDDFGQIVLISCRDISIRGQSMGDVDEAILVINSDQIDVELVMLRNCSTAIDVRDSRDISISDVTFLDSGVGVVLGMSERVTIDRCIFHTIASVGVYVAGGANFTLRSSQIMYSVSSGIEVSSVADGLVVDSSFVNGTFNGISLTSSTGFRIENNTITNNGKSGIAVSYSNNNTIRDNSLAENMDGLSISYSSNSTIANNEITNSMDNGIELMDSANITLLDNFILNSTGYGIILDHLTEACLIINNTIVWSQTANGHDSGMDNVWVHNAWSDYDGVSPYDIAGSAGAQDQDPQQSDIDNDGLSGWEEVNTYGTSPFRSDTDGDGIDDGSEIAAGLNPLNPHDAAIAQGDYSSLIPFAGVVASIVALFYLRRKRN